MERIYGFLEMKDKMNMLDLSEEKLKELYEEHFVESAIHNDEVWERLSRDLDAVIQAKVQEKTQAAVLWRRSDGCGTLAWVWIHTWYLQTTGLGLSQRRASLMNPAQCSKDEEVMFSVQK